MQKTSRKKTTPIIRRMAASVVAMVVIVGAPTGASADEAYAKKTLKAMSDYMTAQKSYSFEYDAVLEVVTKEAQKLALVSSGSLALVRPDKVHAKRRGGFADVDMSFDGKTLTLFGKNVNMYAQVEIPGSLGNLVDVLQNKYNRPLPAADLLLPNPYDFMMEDVDNIKDLGVGVVGGVTCDYFAFRAKEFDWQIWIAEGDKPYPCRYTINSKNIQGQPEYTIQIRNWKAGEAIDASQFSFNNATGAKQVDIGKLGDSGLPENFSVGENK
jgi:hypothetical protein